MPKIYIKQTISSICEEKYWNINAKSPMNRISTVSYSQARIQGFEKWGSLFKRSVTIGSRLAPKFC